MTSGLVWLRARRKAGFRCAMSYCAVSVCSLCLTGRCYAAVCSHCQLEPSLVLVDAAAYFDLLLLPLAKWLAAWVKPQLVSQRYRMEPVAALSQAELEDYPAVAIAHQRAGASSHLQRRDIGDAYSAVHPLHPNCGRCWISEDNPGALAVQPPAQPRALVTSCDGCAGRAEWWASLSPPGAHHQGTAMPTVDVGAVTIAFRAKSSFKYSAAQSMVPTDVTVQLSSDGGHSYHDVATERYASTDRSNSSPFRSSVARAHTVGNSRGLWCTWTVSSFVGASY